MGEVAITVERLAKGFRRADGQWLPVIDGLSFDVEQGALVSVIGPSGCGKSTLLNIISGLERPSDGRIMLGGTEVAAGRRSDANIAVIFQQPRLLNWRTVRDNVRLPLRERRLSRAEARARTDHYLDLVGLTDFAGYYPLQLSGGMQQRVSLARGLAIEPDLVLADEPFSSLDELTARRLREEFVRLWQTTGRTVIFVTHNIREAVYLSTRMIVVTARPCSVHLDVPIDVPYPRSIEDDRLFDIEKTVTRKFLDMEEDVEEPVSPHETVAAATLPSRSAP